MHELLVQPDHRLDHVRSGITEQRVYNTDRVIGVEKDDVVVDSSPDEILLIKQGVIRRIPRASPQPTQ